MYGQIYIIETTESPKYYIGSTICIDLERYLNQQKSAARTGRDGKPLLYRAMRKYGVDTFSIRPLAEASSEQQLCLLEELWVELLSSRNPKVGYNAMRGGRRPPKFEGQSHPMYGKRGELSPLYGKPLSEEHRKNIGSGHKGKPKSEAHKKKLSEARKALCIPSPNKGKKMSNEQRQKVSDGLKRYFASHELSPETIEKKRLASLGRPAPNKGIPISEETRAKISAANLGRVVSSETRERMSQAAYRRWENRRGQNGVA